MAEELQQVLSPDGELAGEPPFGIEETRRLYRAMVAARLYDRKGTALQKQGRLATYAPFEGQEAAQIGSAAALRSDDWMVATYRDAAAMAYHGYPRRLLLLGRMGDERGGSPPEGVNVLPPSITVGAHMLHAVGLAWAERLQGRDRIALTYFGDGATSEGDFHEAMNFAGVYQTPVVFLCENNQYAISLRRDRQTASSTIAGKAEGYGIPGVLVDGNDLFAVYGVTAEAVQRARSGGGPTLIEALTYRLGPHTTSDDPRRYRSDEEEAEWRDRDPVERVRRYLAGAGAWTEGWQKGIEAEESAAIEAAVEEAEALPPQNPEEVFQSMFAEMTPQLKEQQGVQGGSSNERSEAAADPLARGAVRQKAERSRGGESMTVLNMAQAINQALDQAMAADPRVMILGEDVGRTGGVFRVTDGLQARYGEERVVDTPVAESGIVGAAFGLAVGGMRPVAEMQFMGFSYPAYDQVISHVSRIRNRSRHRFTAPLVIRIPYGGGIGAAEHHSESTEAIYAHIPGVKVVVPGSPRDAKGLLLAAIEDPDPVVFLEPIRLYRAIKEDVPDQSFVTPIGESRVVRSGEDVTVVAWGSMLREARVAADLLEEQGIDAEVLDLRSLVPLDGDGVIASVEKTRRAVVVHEAPRTAGLGGELIALIQERALYSLEAPVARVTGWDTVFPLKRSEHLYLPTPQLIARTVQRVMGS